MKASPKTNPAAFGGFTPEAFGFFRALAKHQDRTWFGEHKAEYEAAVQGPLASLVSELSTRLAKAGSPLRGDPRRSLFRLHRDVRFSADKRPYKTHASAVLTRAADKRAPGLLYFHLDPAGSFAAAGFFQPESGMLRLMREKLADAPAAWEKVERTLVDRALELVRDDVLMRLPRGFESTPPAVADALKLKSWIVRRNLTPEQVGSTGLIDLLVEFARAASPLLEFGWAALPQAET